MTIVVIVTIMTVIILVFMMNSTQPWLDPMYLYNEYLAGPRPQVVSWKYENMEEI